MRLPPPHTLLVLAVVVCAPGVIFLGALRSYLAVETPGRATSVYDFDDVDAVLAQAVDSRAFPGCAGRVGDASGVLHTALHGSQTYGLAPPAGGENRAVDATTLFDMASLTKVVATTTAVMTFYQRGELDLDMLVSDESLLGAAFAGQGKDTIRIHNLLVHNAGFPPDPVPNFWSVDFACPQTSSDPAHHPAEDFSCQDKIYAALLVQTLINPVGAKYVYSDLSMITTMYIVGIKARDLVYVAAGDLLPGCDQGGADRNAAAMCYYEAYVRLHVMQPLGMTSSQFRLPEAQWRDTMPTWNDTVYQHRVMQGFVSDGNAYALGGIAGHAGLFSHLDDVTTFAKRILFAAPDDALVNATTVAHFTRVQNATQSSRALGWNTNAPDNDYNGCSSLSAATFTHTGYTGTQICMDPVRQIFTILLTNRVYPDNANADNIHRVRRDYNHDVQVAVDAARAK